MFDNILNTASITTEQILICLGIALACGIAISLSYLFSNKHYTKSFAVALIILPALVQIIIMMVNGSIGTGVAIAGAFALIRFRSVAAGAKDICTVFFAMVIGLVIGAGYVGYAILFTIILCAIYIILSKSKFADANPKERQLTITIPEELDYAGAFEDVFNKYTTNHELVKVKTVDLGSLYKLHYNVTLKDAKQEKQFIDDMRCRNGNLTVTMSLMGQGKEEL